jgi:hypothetical protein
MKIAYQWTQIPVGIPVNMAGANTSTPIFTAPTLPYDTTLAFSLRVMSNDGMVSTNHAVVYVMVKRYSGASAFSGIPQQQPLQQQQPLVPSQQQLPPIQQQIMPPQQQYQQLQPVSPQQQQQQPPLSTYPYPYSSTNP